VVDEGTRYQADRVNGEKVLGQYICGMREESVGLKSISIIYKRIAEVNGISNNTLCFINKVEALLSPWRVMSTTNKVRMVGKERRVGCMHEWKGS
jgi:hypothetical protein